MERWREATAAQPRLWNQSKYRLAGHSFDSQGRPQLQVRLFSDDGGGWILLQSSPVKVETQLRVGFGKLISLMMVVMVLMVLTADGDGSLPGLHHQGLDKLADSCLIY